MPTHCVYEVMMSYGRFWMWRWIGSPMSGGSISLSSILRTCYLWLS
ncbi:Uncharacterised protein [Vibrio cholerae]|nr:Uncharacterised protein [Vibrio cholerae]